MSKQLYDSFGQVKVRLKEAIDLGIYAPLTDKRAERDIIHYKIFATIGISRETGCEQDNAVLDNTSASSYSTSAYRSTCTYDSKVIFDEEYVFDGVLSTQSCIVSIYKLVVYSNSDETYRYESRPQCIGYTIVPVRRLEEHVPISQWYQLTSSSSHDGLRSAIDLQVLYEKKGVKLRQRGGLGSSPPPSVEASKDAHAADVTHNDEASYASPPVAAGVAAAAAASSDKVQDSDDDSDADDDEEGNVEMGLADYVIICGPRNFRSASTRASVTTAESALSEGKLGDLDVCIWDRYPLLDHSDLPLPTRIEWFAAPEGTVLVDSTERPEPAITTFVLSTSGMLPEQYGICMTIFVNCGTVIVSDASPKEGHGASRDSEGSGDEKWWEGSDSAVAMESSGDDVPKGGNLSTFVGVKICIITRRPYLRQFSQVLTSIYYSYIEKGINEWENQFSYHFVLGQMMSVEPFALPCEKVLVTLISDCPVPVPSTFSVHLKMTDPENAITRIDDDIPSTIDFLPPSPSQLPESKFPVDSLFSLIGIRAAIDVLACAMCEYKLLFHSADLAKLPVVCESIRSLVYPMQWAHVYIPTVPSPLLSIVEAPVPFLLGTHSKWLSTMHTSSFHDVVVVDCDSGAVIFGKDLAPVRFPAKTDRWLMVSLKLILLPRPRCDDRTHVSASRHCKMSRSRQIQLVFADVMVNMFRDVPSCIYYLGPQSPVFNRLQFLNLCSSSDVRDFVGRVIMTNSFSYFTDSLCKNERMIYFINRVKSLTQNKSSDADETAVEREGVAESSSAESTQQRKLGLRPPLSIDTAPALAARRQWVDASYSSDPVSALEFILGEHDESAVEQLPAISIYLYEAASSSATTATRLAPLSLGSECSDLSSAASSRPRNGSSAAAAVSGSRTRTNSEAPLQQGRPNKDVAAVLSLVTERTNESTDIEVCQSPFIVFGKQFDVFLVAAQTWTLDYIAAHLSTPCTDLRDCYAKYRTSALSGVNNLMQDDSQRTVTSSIASKTASTTLPYYLTFLLERVISGSIVSEDDADIVQVLGLCNDLLEDRSNRHELIRALKLSRDSSDGTPDYTSGGVNVIVRLSRMAFSVLSSLFSMVLEACTNSSDFSVAYNLLIVGGQYYHSENPKSALGKRQSRHIDNSATNAEFLNSQIRHHPIYQNVSFWKAVIRDNTETLNASSSTELGPRSIINEASNTIRLMHELGINADRALMVMQAISIDYNLDIQTFFDLQRQCSTLWKHNFANENVVETDAEGGSRGGGTPTQGEAATAFVSSSSAIEAENGVGAIVADESLHTSAAKGFSEISLSRADSYSVSSIDISNNFLICGHYQNNIKIFNLDSGVTKEVTHGKRVSDAGEGVAFVRSLANNCFLSASYDGIVNIWTWPRAKLNDFMESPNAALSAPKSSSFFSNGSLPYSNNKEEKRMKVAVIKSHSHAISAVMTSSVGSDAEVGAATAWCVATGDRVGNISLSVGTEGVDGLESRSVSLRTSSQIDAVTSLCFTDKASIAGATASGSLAFMDYRSGKVLHEYRAHERAVTDIISLRSHEILTVSLDRAARLWDTRASMKGQDRTIGSGTHHISAVCAGASWDNYLVACGNADGTINMFDLRFDLVRPVLTFRGHRGRISSLHFDGMSSGLLRSASTDGCTRLWDSVKSVCMQTNHVYDCHVGVSEMKISSVEERFIDDDDPDAYTTLSSGNRYCITRSFAGVVKVFTI